MGRKFRLYLLVNSCSKYFNVRIMFRYKRWLSIYYTDKNIYLMSEKLFCYIKHNMVEGMICSYAMRNQHKAEGMN